MNCERCNLTDGKDQLLLGRFRAHLCEPCLGDWIRETADGDLHDVLCGYLMFKARLARHVTVWLQGMRGAP